MPPDKLIRMANQIATFFQTQPGNDQVQRVAAHLNDFWSPEMRATLKAKAEQDDSALNDLVKQALALI